MLFLFGALLALAHAGDPGVDTTSIFDAVDDVAAYALDSCNKFTEEHADDPCVSVTWTDRCNIDLNATCLQMESATDACQAKIVEMYGAASCVRLMRVDNTMCYTYVDQQCAWQTSEAAHAGDAARVLVDAAILVLALACWLWLLVEM